MSQNPAQAVAVPLQTFGSWVTEMSPDSLPEGVSPDNQDIVFLPGTAGGRPALQKVLPPFPSGGPGNRVPTVIYGKSFTTSAGVVKNLYFDSNGVLWVEDLTSSPGTYTQLFSATPGSFCRSLTFGGKEYFAFSDGLHGSDIPLQYDGTNIDRVTQDGPGSPPSVASFILPSSQMQASAPATISIGSITSTDLVYDGGVRYYTSLTVGVTSGSVAVGDSVVISGNGNAYFNGLAVSVDAIVPGGFKSLGWYLSSYEAGSGGTGTVGSGTTARRSNNIVTIQTATNHNLQVGYLAQISGMAASQVGGSISSIVIRNADNPGIATVKTSAPHGLLPGNQVNISGVSDTSAGAISSVARRGQVSTITTSTNHGLSIGSFVNVNATTNTSFNGRWYVSDVPTPTSFTYAQADSDLTATSDTGTVSYVWPLASSDPALNYFTVETAPTPTSFTVSLSYTDGTWTGGAITFGWDGKFYVASVPNGTTFTYQQYGPNATSAATGTVTPYGQAAPGLHLCRQSFLTRQGQLTRPSPWTQFEANGGQYLAVTNLAIGPSNVVARVLEFTGSQGSFFYYIPTAPQVNGQVVGTATQINDNVTTAVILDFGDPTLYTGIGTSTPTYNTSGQIVLDGVLNYLSYKQRLSAIGMRNCVNGFLNMGFDGGYQGAISSPTGWNAAQNTGGELVTITGRPGFAWQMPGADVGPGGQLSQSACQNQSGAPILEGNTFYSVRCWLWGTGTATFYLQSPGQTYIQTVAAQGSASGKWVTLNFPAATPDTIPSDLIFGVYNGNAGAVTVDEICIFPTQNPYIETEAIGSYLDAPEQFNGVTGLYGPPDDTHKIMGGAVIRNTLYLLTQDPEGRLHQVNAGNTEPAGWDVEEVDSACGLLSAAALTTSQTDDRTASGGEEWMAWASQSGARIFGGGSARKISQEIQSAWFDQQNTNWPQINMAAATTVWALNDPVSRTIYFGLPLASATAPSIIYPMNYRELDSAEAIAGSPPFHPSFSGRLIATDNTRKWTRWNVKINGAALMFRAPGTLSLVLFGGNGQTYGSAAGFGNIYTLNPAKLTDDDYGQISPYYVTCALPTTDQEQAFQLDAGLKSLQYFSFMASGVGTMTVTALIDNLTNAWPFTCVRTLQTNPGRDLEWGGGNVTGQRVFFKFASSPVTGTDNTFLLRKMNAWWKKNRIPVAGAL